MSRQHDGKTKRHRGTMRTVLWSASVTIALCVGGPMAPVASAQSSNAPVLDSQRPDGGPMPAPVGHRQPRESDLPPSVARDERDPGASRDQKATAAAQRAFDRSLDICRGC